MNTIRKRVQNGEFLSGTWCSLGSPVVAEISALCDFDWLLLDAEHAPSTTSGLMAQMQAISRFNTAPIVRIPWLDRVAIKWSLDIGAAGIMIPYVETVAQAQEAISFMRYAPEGVRGVAGATRSSDFGLDFPAYFAEANQNLLAVAQIETGAAVENSRAIAAVDGVDVLFVGPMDLSTSLDMPKRFADPEFLHILEKIAANARAEGKACGILLPSLDLVPLLRDMGYTFVAISSDVNILAKHLKEITLGLRSQAETQGRG